MLNWPFVPRRRARDSDQGESRWAQRGFGSGRRVTPGLLEKWHHEMYSPAGTVVGIAGDVSAPQALTLVKRYLSGWHPAGKENVPPEPPRPSQRTVAVVDLPNALETSLVVGNLAIDRRSADLIPVSVSNRILGGTGAARLYVNLRDQKGYAYGIFSTINPLKYSGAWKALTDVRTEVTAPALQSILDEILRLQTEKVPEPELTSAKRSMAAAFALSLEDPNQLLNYFTISSIYGYSKDYWDNYPAKIMEVTAAEVREVARKYLSPDHLQIAAAGDAKKIAPTLKAFGPIQIYDAEGKRTIAARR